MKIAQVAPLFESVPPTRYGGTERVVSWLTEELKSLGHEVTLFASGDSHTSAELVPCGDRALRLAHVEDIISPHVLQLERVFDSQRQFDVIHFHTGTIHMPLARRSPVPSVTTMHGRLDVPELEALMWEMRELPLVSISDEQRDPAPWCNWARTVHHGQPPELLRFDPRGGGFLAFLGRISPEKGPLDAIHIARAAGMPLVMAAKIDTHDQRYFDDVIAPLVSADPSVTFLGEVDDAGKQALLGGARGLLFPIDWPEPFGLAMIEAMACGTPVIARRRGSVPSLVEQGRSGFIIDDIESGIEAVRQLNTLDRVEVRASFERRFTARRMALDYVSVYEKLIESGSKRQAEGETMSWGHA